MLPLTLAVLGAAFVTFLAGARAFFAFFAVDLVARVLVEDLVARGGMALCTVVSGVAVGVDLDLRWRGGVVVVGDKGT